MKIDLVITLVLILVFSIVFFVMTHKKRWLIPILIIFIVVTICILMIYNTDTRYFVEIIVDGASEHHYEDNGVNGIIRLPENSTRIQKTSLTDAKYVTLSSFNETADMYSNLYSSNKIFKKGKVLKMQIKNKDTFFEVTISEEKRFTFIEFKKMLSETKTKGDVTKGDVHYLPTLGWKRTAWGRGSFWHIFNFCQHNRQNQLEERYK